MKGTFFKNLFRDIKKTLSRFLSIVIIIAVGVAFYAGVRATSPDMKMSGDYYFKENNLMDFKLISTLGLTDEDLSEIGKQPGVTKAEGSYSLDAVIEKGDYSMVLNINSQPEKDGINIIRLTQGRRAQNSNEAVVEQSFMEENNFKIGDKIVLQSGTEDSIGDSLKNNEFEIVGAAESPLYISEQRQLSSVGNGSVRGFVYILPEVFKSEVFTEIYVRTESAESENSLLNNGNYVKVNKVTEEKLKDLGPIRGEIRYTEVITEANDKLKEAEDKLSSAKKEAEDKFAEAYKKLEDARNKIARGKVELRKNEAFFNEEIAKGLKEITDGKNAILSGENELNSRAKEIEGGKLQIAEGKKQLDSSEVELNFGRQQAAEGISSSVLKQLDELKKLLEENPANPVLLAQHSYLNRIYENDIKGKDFDNMYASLKESGGIVIIQPYMDIESLKYDFDRGAAKIAAGREQLAGQEKQLQEGENQLNAGREALEANKKRIDDGEIQLNKSRQEGLSKLSAARKELGYGEREVNENLSKLKSEEEKANNEIKEGEAELQENKDKLKDIKKPEWYVLGRTANVGYETYRQDSDRIDNIGKAFPLIFFLVAALVSLTTMTRMVQENRIEIGTFKALGYSRGAIVSHYLIYSLSASLIGSLAGISFGFRLFPPLIMNAYGSLYTIPDKVTRFDTGIALLASMLAVLFTTLAAVAATLEELRETPASLLRPKPPKSGKRILLERITFIWKRLSFTKKVTARNIFRYKQRFFMTVVGIAACTGLMVSGFGLKEGIVGATEKQFSDIYRYDMKATLVHDIDDGEKAKMKDKVIKDSNIKSLLFAYSKNGSVDIGETRSEDAYIVIPEEKTAFGSYINLRMGDKPLAINDEGVIITKKFSKLINKKIGDTVEIKVDDRILKVEVSGITEQYIQHFVYMSREYYEKIAGEKILFNSFYGLLQNNDEYSLDSTSNNLNSISGIGSASFKSNTHIDFSKSVDSINSVVLILIVSAGILAFVVIYNLTNININERRRELATIKLLGFFNNELASYIYRENIILTIIGSLTGILFGVILNNYITLSAETNIMMFLRTIRPVYFLYSVVLTIIFSIVVNLIMYNKFDKIDMIESLKSAE